MPFRKSPFNSIAFSFCTNDSDVVKRIIAIGNERIRGNSLKLIKAGKSNVKVSKVNFNAIGL